MDAQDELITDFIEEAKEIIDKLDIGVVELEKNPENSKNLGNVFRAMHTLKGSSGFFALKRIEKIAHNAESVLGKMRDGHIRPNHRIINALLQVNDILRAIISALEINAAEPPGDDAPMISELVAAAQAAGSLADTAPESIASDPPNASLRGLRQGGIDASVDHAANTPIGGRHHCLKGRWRQRQHARGVCKPRLRRPRLGRCGRFSSGCRGLGTSQGIGRSHRPTHEQHERVGTGPQPPVAFCQPL
ncbi:MAG: hypothetical protein EBQ71_10540 [Betaproteobacteria bacterium]|nr:hypothetical protein [Betaproteobacteria bacterium]